MSTSQGPDFSDLEAKYNVPYESPLDSIVILSGIPKVEGEKIEKLTSALAKTCLKQAGVKISKDSIDLVAEGGKTTGIAFLTLNDETEAKNVLRGLDGFAFDKKHTFVTLAFSELEKLDVPDEFVEPEEDDWKPKKHFRSWLSDSAGRDQLVMFNGDQAALVWSGRNGAQETAQDLTTDSYFQWSPQGAFLATLHSPGVVLWSGNPLERLNRFPHPNVKLIDFSPDERFLVTWSPKPIEYIPNSKLPSPFTEENEGHMVAVWETVTGTLVRTLPVLSDASKGEQKRLLWPVLKWSPDSKFCARVNAGQSISVYELPAMNLMGLKSIKIEGVVDFEWAPWNDKEKEDFEAGTGGRENMFAFWTPEIANQPARVNVMTLQSRKVVATKNLFNVHECKLHWQSSGDYLCVAVDRHTKTKKTQFSNLEIFRVRVKDCPVQAIETKEVVTAFSWEPKGDRFAIVSTSDPNYGQTAPGQLLRTTVSFYGLDARKGDFLLLRALEPKSFNAIYWSPIGRHLVLAQIGSSSKFDLEFYDMDLDKDLGTPAAIEDGGIRMIGNGENYGMTDIAWDPSGRYLACSGSVWIPSPEPGYAIYSFNSSVLVKVTAEKFKQLAWRPRPPTILPKDQQKKVRKNLRDYSRQFEEQDELDERNDSKELIENRNRLISEWNTWRQNCQNVLQKLGVVPAVQQEDTKRVTVEEWVEEVIAEVEEEL